MKTTLLACAFGVLLSASCTPKNFTIQLTNTLDFDRNHELVTFSLAEFGSLGQLVDADGKEVHYQVVDDTLAIFLADVPANGQAVYTMRSGVPATPSDTLVKAFFLGERRLDDFAWENEHAAFRMYGPGMKNGSNGVDLWLKHGNKPVADALYRQHEAGTQYHIDCGLGLDAYAVGRTPGCGGLCFVHGDTLFVGGTFTQYDFDEKKAGPLQTQFSLSYRQFGQKGFFPHTNFIRSKAGSLLCESTVNYNMNATKAYEGYDIGAGIFLHNHYNPDDTLTYHIRVNMEEGWIAYAEPAVSDGYVAGLHHSMGLDSIDYGRCYSAVILPGMKNARVIDRTLTATRPFDQEQNLSYYFGGGWSKNGFPTDEDWFEATSRTARALKNPIIVTIK